MSTRNFDRLFTPRSIALVGASNKAKSIGAVLADNLLNGGFEGPIMPVNPHEKAIRSTICYSCVGELPIVPDLAVIATPARTVPGLIAELGALGCRAAIVISAGFEETNNSLRKDMLEAARPYLMRIVGPNCLGFLSPHLGINASFAHLAPAAGDIAFVSQSGAIAATMFDWAAARTVGFSQVLSLGDMSDVDFGDVLDHLALDPSTKAILLYVEMITHARKFMSAARIAARAKPVIVVKAGRSQAGARAAMSHTGALAGSDAVYDAAFRRAGLLRVVELRDLFDAAATLSTGLRIAGDRLTIVTNGGGLGVLAADALDQHSGRLSDLPEATIARLDSILPKAWSRRNPIDMIGDADGARYAAALEALFEAPSEDAILVMNCPTGVADSLEAANGVLDVAHKSKTPLLTCWVGQATAEEARRKFEAHKLPALETPDEAIRAFMHLVSYRRNQDVLLETPRPEIALPQERRDMADRLLKSVLTSGRKDMTGPEAKSLLSAYGIPVVASYVARDADEAAIHAKAIGAPVALKILSPDISHKSDVGGVKLGLEASDVPAAAKAILKSVAEHAPSARISGFTVEPFAERELAHELILGVSRDATFGPVILFGRGGVAVEMYGDSAIGLPPLNSVLARELISRTKVAKFLKGYRNIPAADMEAITTALVTLSQLVIDHPEIAELDINPLLASAKGVIALDARIRLGDTAEEADRLLAIRPYPFELEHSATLENGLSLDIRPIRPQDEIALTQMIERSSQEDRRLRFLHALAALPYQMAARLSQIDYDREMALVAAEKIGGAFAGIARLVSDPNFESAEFAVMVRTDLKGRGLGRLLMRAILDYARSRGLKRLFGDVLAANGAMLALAKELGAATERSPSPDIMRVSFDLERINLTPGGSKSSKTKPKEMMTSATPFIRPQTTKSDPARPHDEHTRVSL